MKPGHKQEIGGQAIIEGVMMKSPVRLALAIRKPDGKIAVKKEKVSSLTKKYRILGLPFVRGIISMFEILSLGYRALSFSANEASEEEEGDGLGFLATAGILVLSVVLAIGIFKFIPLFAVQMLSRRVDYIQGSILFYILEGVLKIGVFVLYLLAISRIKDVHRIFMYHGAEHKTVGCYESSQELTPENAARFPKEHPRCGTSFLLIVILISIVFYAFIPQGLAFYEKLLYRILLLPLIAGVSYEILKISARYRRNLITRLLIVPGMLTQKLTTKEPDRKQIEVAIAALKGVL
ncbi:MAG: DUF1385 domain-containing protein [archaeon]